MTLKPHRLPPERNGPHADMVASLRLPSLPYSFTSPFSTFRRRFSAILRRGHHPLTPLSAGFSSRGASVCPPVTHDRSNKQKLAVACLNSNTKHNLDGSAGDEDEDDESGIEEGRYVGIDVRDATNASSFIAPERWDVLGLGQAMVDFSGMVNEEFLEKVGLVKGTRKLVDHEVRGRVLRAMDGCTYKVAAGGSLSNSLVALARLGTHTIGRPPLSIAMAGSVGSDPLGGFYRAKLRRANVNFLSEPIYDGTTGTVIVLTTPDAQRTMLAYQGTSSTINYDPCLAGMVSKSNILIVEGYLFELPDTIKTIVKACEAARKSGALVAITASDVSCIENQYDDFWEVVGEYADIVFANSEEARAFCHFSSKESPVSATRYLSHFVPLVSVTDGPRGSYFGVKGEAIFIPPSPCIPIDTCGAGDAYASGVLYGILQGAADLKGIGALAARVASTVVGQQGTRLRVQDAVGLAESFACHVENTGAISSVPSDHVSSL